MRISDWSSDVCSSDLPQWQARAVRDLDGAVRPLLRADSAEEGEVAALARSIERQQIARQAIIYGARPVHRWQGAALIVGNRDKGHIGEGAVNRRQVGQV